MYRHLSSTILPVLAVCLVVSLPARVAEAGVSQPSWTLPLSIHQDDDRLAGLKRKWRISRPQLETSHTNQPPAPPSPPDSPLQDPDQGAVKRVIDLTPRVLSAPPIGDPLPLPGPGDLIGLGSPESVIGGAGVWLGPIGSTPGLGGDVISETGVTGVGIAAPSVVPGPGAIGLLLAAGLASGRRRRRG